MKDPSLETAADFNEAATHHTFRNSGARGKCYGEMGLASERMLGVRLRIWIKLSETDRIPRDEIYGEQSVPLRQRMRIAVENDRPVHHSVYVGRYLREAEVFPVVDSQDLHEKDWLDLGERVGNLVEMIGQLMVLFAPLIPKGNAAEVGHFAKPRKRRVPPRIVCSDRSKSLHDFVKGEGTHLSGFPKVALCSEGLSAQEAACFRLVPDKTDCRQPFEWNVENEAAGLVEKLDGLLSEIFDFVSRRADPGVLEAHSSLIQALHGRLHRQIYRKLFCDGRPVLEEVRFLG